MLKTMLDTAIEAAHTAGQHAREKFGHSSTQYKSDEQIVTQADRFCQEIIINRIRQSWPQHGFLAEENPDPKMPLLKITPTDEEQTWWVIDPIDGTRNFAHGIPLFAVSIGVIRLGLPVVGVVYDPMRDDLFSARTGQPAQRNGRTVCCIDEPLHRNSQIAVAGHYKQGPPDILGKLTRKHVLINLGSAALHYAYVGSGLYAASFGWDVRLWDIAAGAAIAQAGGATVTKVDGQERFPFDCENYQGEVTQVLFSGPTAHKELLSLQKS